MHYLQETIAILKQADRLGCRVLENGTRLIGHVPHVAPEAWLHKIFAPISDREIDELEGDVAIKFPEVFRDFRALTNGLSMFSGNLSIYGLRTSWERKGGAIWQPFSIVTSNTVERLADAKKSFLFVGGYKSGKGYYLYIDTNDLSVYRCSRQSAMPLQKWNGFPEMLVSEATRLAALFDEQGRRIDPARPVV